MRLFTERVLSVSRLLDLFPEHQEQILEFAWQPPCGCAVCTMARIYSKYGVNLRVRLPDALRCVRDAP